MRASERERAAPKRRVVRLRLRSRGARGSRGASSVEYGLIIALIGAVLCLGIGYTVKGILLGAFDCIISNMQGSTSAGCSGSPGGGDDGGGPGGIVPGTSKPTPTVTPTPTPTPTPTLSS